MTRFQKITMWLKKRLRSTEISGLAIAIEISRTWYIKTKIIPVIIGDVGTILQIIIIK